MITASLGQGEGEGFPSTGDEYAPPTPSTPAEEIERFRRETEYAEDEARRRRQAKLVLGGAAAVLLVATAALIVITREPGSYRKRKSVRPGDVFCKWGRRYRVDGRGGMHVIGNC
jgi:hypothetical protein